MVRGGFKKEKFKANGKEQCESPTRNTTTTKAEGEIESGSRSTANAHSNPHCLLSLCDFISWPPHSDQMKSPELPGIYC